AGNVIEVRDSRTLPLGPPDPDARNYLAAEPFLESDAPEVRAEAAKAVEGVEGGRARAERLVRYVNALLEKKPTVSLASALDVQVAPGSTPVLVGRTASDMRPMDIPIPRRDGGERGCWSRPPR